MVLVVDSEGSGPFASLSGGVYSEPLLCLLSPQRWEGQAEPGLFTLFLHAPLPAFCVLCGVRTPEACAFGQSTAILSEFFAWLTEFFRSCSGVAPSFLRFFEDDFLQTFILRFVFCYAVMSQFLQSNSKGPEWLPASQPALPSALLAHPTVITAVTRIAQSLGVAPLFGPPQASPSPLTAQTVVPLSPPGSPLQSQSSAPPLPPSPYGSKTQPLPH
jgi:hypothetical protein